MKKIQIEWYPAKYHITFSHLKTGHLNTPAFEKLRAFAEGKRREIYPAGDTVMQSAPVLKKFFRYP